MTTKNTTAETILRALDRQLNPAPLKIYKPHTTELAKGAAVKFDLRLEPTYKESYIEDVEGGLFLELVPQKTLKAGGTDATFDWESPNKIIAKLGLPDITALLVAIRCRWTKRLIPKANRPKEDEIGATISLFHKFEGETAKTTTAITYELKEDGGMLKLSRSSTNRNWIKFSISEELLLEAYLQHALAQFLLVGKR